MLRTHFILKCLFCLGLGPGNVERVTQRKIFSMIAKANRVIWSISNEVLLSNERKGVEKVTSLVNPIMSRIKNGVSCIIRISLEK